MINRTGKYTVVEACNDHGAITLREYPRNGTLYVVEYDDGSASAVERTSVGVYNTTDSASPTDPFPSVSEAFSGGAATTCR